MGGVVSSGENNDDLVDTLVEHSCIVSAPVERLCRAVDRGHFVTDRARHAAYRDSAWRQQRLHLSAPCIYTAVLENLALRPGHRFLNIGSGTGYLSTMAGLAVGLEGANHGIELFAEVVQYARERVSAFVSGSWAVDQYDFCEPLFVVGNVLQLSLLPSEGELEEEHEVRQGGSLQRYDRVYCGAGCTSGQLQRLRQLLQVGGVLVAPVNDSLVRVERLGERRWRCDEKLSVSFAPLRTPDENLELDFEADDEDRSASDKLEEASAQLVQLPGFCPASLLQLCRATVRQLLRHCVQLDIKQEPHSAGGVTLESGQQQQRQERQQRRRRSRPSYRSGGQFRLVVPERHGDDDAAPSDGRPAPRVPQRYLERMLWGAVISLAEGAATGPGQLPYVFFAEDTDMDAPAPEDRASERSTAVDDDSVSASAAENVRSEDSVSASSVLLESTDSNSNESLVRGSSGGAGLSVCPPVASPALPGDPSESTVTSVGEDHSRSAVGSTGAVRVGVKRFSDGATVVGASSEGTAVANGGDAAGTTADADSLSNGACSGDTSASGVPVSNDLDTVQCTNEAEQSEPAAESDSARSSAVEQALPLPMQMSRTDQCEETGADFQQMGSDDCGAIGSAGRDDARAPACDAPSESDALSEESDSSDGSSESQVSSGSQHDGGELRAAINSRRRRLRMDEPSSSSSSTAASDDEADGRSAAHTGASSPHNSASALLSRRMQERIVRLPLPTALLLYVNLGRPLHTALPAQTV